MNDILKKTDKLAIPYAVKGSGHINHKQVDTNARTVDVIANTYNWIDTDGDVLINGVAAKSIQERGPDSSLPGKIKHLSNHNLTKGIGKIETIEETKFEGMDVLRMQSIMSETDLGEETLVKYKEGLIDQHSIGFRYLDLEFMESESEAFDAVVEKLINPQDAIDRGFLWLVKEIRLFEVSSLDGFGANRLTPFLGSKSENKTIQYNNYIAKLDALEQAYRNSGDKHSIELQSRQLKQMIYELLNPEPDPKDTSQGPSRKSTFDALEYINTLNL